MPLFAEFDLTLTGASIELLDVAEEVSSSTASPIRTHLKIDTGMERVGLREYEAAPFILKSAAYRHIFVEGIYTHLDSMLNEKELMQRQLQRFQEVVGMLKAAEYQFEYIHSAASGAA